MGLRIALLVVWIVAAVVLRMRGERFWRSVVQGLFVSFAVVFGVRLLLLALAAFADWMG